MANVSDTFIYEFAVDRHIYPDSRDTSKQEKGLKARNMRVSAAKMKIKKILYSVVAAIVFIIYAMVSFAACTIGDNTIIEEKK